MDLEHHLNKTKTIQFADDLLMNSSFNTLNKCVENLNKYLSIFEVWDIWDHMPTLSWEPFAI